MAEWRPVVGFEGLYLVSDEGDVRGSRGWVMRPQLGRGGRHHDYLSVQLHKDGRYHNRLVHVLVAEAFLGPRPAGLEVNHRDGNKWNNGVRNLEWCTRSANITHAYRLGLRRPNVARLRPAA